MQLYACVRLIKTVSLCLIFCFLFLVVFLLPPVRLKFFSIFFGEYVLRRFDLVSEAHGSSYFKACHRFQDIFH